MRKLQIMNGVSRKFHKLGFTVKKHSPEILLVTGIISGVTAAVMACKATTKLDDILDKAKNDIEEIHYYENHPEELAEEYPAETVKKDLTLVYARTGFNIVKLYAPAVTLGGLAVTSILASHNLMRGRNAALAAAYATVDNGFKNYRNRVVDRFGEKVDKELRYNVKAKEVDEVVTDENGEDKVVKKTVEVANVDQYSDYSRIFDETCAGWVKDPEQNRFFISQVQKHANEQLQRKGYLFLNDVYEMLGFQRSRAGQQVGWIYDPRNPYHKGDNYVDFGIMDCYTGNEKHDERKRAFINGLERSVIIEFNVDGDILSKF